MQSGVDIIYQATLKLGEWSGRADFLKKVNKPSELWPWSYEVIDAKLAKQTRVGTIMQLCLYSEMVAALQGLMPEYMHVLTNGNHDNEFTYRLDDFLAYYRSVKKRLAEAISNFAGPATTYPLPCPFCTICNWWVRCESQWRGDDHLSFVAGLATGQLMELGRQQVKTLEALSRLPIPLPFRPQRGAIETYERLREQARVQAEARTSGMPVYELIEIVEGKGFFKLPSPSIGDIFFDFEGDPFVGNTGMEYLFGWIPADAPETYHRLWALNQSEEKKAFESFVDTLINRWEKHPDFHIYHFTAYEPSALKRLMGKYATRENEVDQMLRAGIFIDLHTITRQAIRAGIETYSLKELEKFHRFERRIELREAAAQLRVVERHIEGQQLSGLDEETVIAVERYNKEDCLSTLQLRDWLETLRAGLQTGGQLIARPASVDGSASEELTQRQQRIAAMVGRLLKGISIDRLQRNATQQAQWLLVNMLDWYRREEKATWWEFFRIRELSAAEMMEEKTGIGGLRFTGTRTSENRSVVDEYNFPSQDHDIREDEDIYSAGEGLKLGNVTAMDTNHHLVKIKKVQAAKDHHPDAIFTYTNVPNKVKEQAIERIAEWVISNDIDADGDYRAGRDLLMKGLPRTSGQLNKYDDPQQKAIGWLLQLYHGVLPIQGPPGAGKSHTAAEMILSLVQAGKMVGITALSHKVVAGLMQKVIRAASEKSVQITCMRKVSELSDNADPNIIEELKNENVVAAIRGRAVNVVGGTAWLWAREELYEAVDVLFVDEAGQLSLIDTLAVSQAATSMVLLGDPQQLQQPQQGSHPEGTEVSALQHILGEHKTIPEEKGIFLDKTWRMHPSICSFTSELFYESRLGAKEDLSNQQLDGEQEFEGAGLYLRAVQHEGNQNSSQQEAEYIFDLIQRLTNGNVFYTDKEKVRKVLTLDDIKVITPYNAQVNLLASQLPPSIQIGTVDKFQGQEAPVIIFSMATSSPSDAPRGMEFLYSANRFNVAVSRARATFILVACPRLFEPDCKSVDQMRLANAFSRYLEVAK